MKKKEKSFAGEKKRREQKKTKTCGMVEIFKWIFSFFFCLFCLLNVLIRLDTKRLEDSRGRRQQTNINELRIIARHCVLLFRRFHNFIGDCGKSKMLEWITTRTIKSAVRFLFFFFFFPLMIAGVIFGLSYSVSS